MMHLNFDTPFELKFLAATGVFEGYASVFHVTDSVNDRILPGAFKDSLQRFHEEKRLPPILWQHDTAEPIGAWREMYEDSHGLFVRGELFINDIPLAREAHKLLKENVVTGLSIGYRVRESHRDQKSGVRVLTKLDLLEVSLVTFPANEQARVSGVKKFFDMANVPSEREFESFLRASGLSRKQSRGVIACGYKALAAAQEEDDEDESAEWDSLIASIKQATEEMKRGIARQQQVSDEESAVYSSLIESIKQATENMKAGFDPAQARDDDGQWTDTGGGGSSGDRSGGGSTSPSAGKLPGVSPSAGGGGSLKPSGYNGPFKPLKVGTTVNHIKDNVLDPDAFPHGNHECGIHVREAVEVGTGATLPRPKSRAAKDFGKPLEHIGFVPVVSTEKGTDYHSGGSYTPEKGDVAVIQSTSKSKAGHTAIFTGWDKHGEVWISDFKQRTFWPGDTYRSEKPSYTIYRHQNRIPVD